MDFLASPEAGLAGLGLSSFLSATLLPGSSEVLLLLLLEQGQIPVVWLVVVASLANAAGGMSTFYLGWWSEAALARRSWYREPSARSLTYVRRWGATALLFSWVPLVGDGLCLAGGWLRLPWLPSLGAMLLGKSLRYMALAWSIQVII